MKIAIVGCAHGELDKIYNTAAYLENQRNEKIDLIICCGDFQATRNESDLRCMAVPEKFYNMGSFYKYYCGEKIAPITTIFIGGNHEASNYLQELPYGGWVAPNIYYMGYAGVVTVGKIRIGGISGIFKPFDYMKGHYERAPFNNETKRSVYHVRNIEVFRLKQVSGVLDIMLSHDWPRGVYNHGCIDELLKNKPFFRKEVNENRLGSEPCEELLFHLKPKYWFSAHLHTKFSALIPHNSNDKSGDEEDSSTKFLALDKCLPRRKYFEIIEVPSENDDSEIRLSYDLEWLTILYLTDHLMSSKRTIQYMPGPNSNERWSFIPTEEEKQFVYEKMGKDLRIPTCFEQTTPSYRGDNRNRYSNPRGRYIPQPRAMLNPQTIDFCLKLGIKDPLSSLIENISCQSYSQNGYDESPFSTPEKAEFSTFLSLDSSSESYRTPSKEPNQDTDDVETSSGELSNEDSFSNSPNNTKNNSSGSAEYLSFISESPISNKLLSDYTSTPENIMKKRKFSFPSFKEPTDESPSTDALPFEIDRTGSAPETETDTVTPSREKKIFKRRNGNIYQND